MSFEIYDDVAFYWFGLAILSIVLLPWACFMIISLCSYCPKHKPISGPVRHLTLDCTCNQLECIEKRAQLKSENRTRTLKSIFSLKNFIFLVLVIIFIIMASKLSNYSLENFADFNPYKILGIEEGSSNSLIKKAYHKLSLLYHPDKNSGDEAAQMFLLITKAYQTLTDPVSRENWEHYGSPDGSAGSSITIGLPSFLLIKNNETFILIIYMLLFVLFLPIIFCIWYTRSARYVRGVLQETAGRLTQLVNSNTSVKFLIEPLAAAAEFDCLDGESYERERIAMIRRVKTDWMKQKLNKPSIIHASALLHSHMLRQNIPDVFTNDLIYILERVPQIINVMLEISFSKFWEIPVFSSIQLHQLTTQGLWPHQSELFQLPAITDNVIKGLKKMRIITLDQFRKTKYDDLDVFLVGKGYLSSKELQYAYDVALSLPDPCIEYSYSTEDEEGIFEGDFVKLTVKIRRNYSDENTIERIRPKNKAKMMLENEAIDAAVAYAPLLPFERKEHWIIVLSNVYAKQNNIQPEAIQSLPLGITEVIEFYLVAPPPNMNLFKLHLCSDCYVGVDKIVDIKIISQKRIVDEKEAPQKLPKPSKRPITMLEEEVELEHNGNDNEESDDDDDEIISNSDSERSDLDFEDIEDNFEFDLDDDKIVEKPPRKIIYLGFRSITELIVFSFILFIILHLIYDYLHARNYI